MIVDSAVRRKLQAATVVRRRPAGRAAACPGAGPARAACAALRSAWFRRSCGLPATGPRCCVTRSRTVMMFSDSRQLLARTDSFSSARLMFSLASRPASMPSDAVAGRRADLRAELGVLHERVEVLAEDLGRLRPAPSPERPSRWSRSPASACRSWSSGRRGFPRCSYRTRTTGLYTASIGMMPISWMFWLCSLAGT